MPNIDPDVKAWELDLAARFGEAVQKRRSALHLTAQQLAQRTADLGYPVTRVAISKIEGNKRAGKVDVAELIVLAKALELPPILLLYPGFPEGYDVTIDESYGPGESFSISFPADVQTLPGQRESSRDAALWFAGQLPSMWQSGGEPIDDSPGRVGAGMVQADALALETADQLDAQRKHAEREDISPSEAESTRRQIKHSEALIARLRHSIRNDQDRLWGAWDERQERARQSLRARGVDR